MFDNEDNIWTVSQAKTHLSEILRRSETEGPQQIGKHRRYIVVPASQWYERNKPSQHFGKWLIENMPRGEDMNFDFDRSSDRNPPFIEDDS